MLNSAANEIVPQLHAFSPPRLHNHHCHATSATTEDVLVEEGQNAIELKELCFKFPKENHPEETSREKRRREKKERKLAQILQREEMKFSHSIQFNAVPDWSNHYISYSNLKKL